MKLQVGVSNRHIHLTEETYRSLFGEEEVIKLKDLKQPGQYASDKVVTLKTEKSVIERVRLLMPFRAYNQVEISRTDAYKLGINPPVRNSGDLSDSETVSVIADGKEVLLKQSTIIATRHIHMDEKFANKAGIKDNQPITVTIKGTKGCYKDILEEKIIAFSKVSKEAYLEIHMDTDDANAFNLKQDDEVEIDYEV